jgi:hypothetical protein
MARFPLGSGSIFPQQAVMVSVHPERAHAFVDVYVDIYETWSHDLALGRNDLTSPILGNLIIKFTPALRRSLDK